jgi:hypothetical protein
VSVTAANTPTRSILLIAVTNAEQSLETRRHTTAAVRWGTVFVAERKLETAFLGYRTNPRESNWFIVRAPSIPPCGRVNPLRDD